MNNPGIKEEIWLALRKKWDELVADGHSLKVEFNLLTDPQDETKAIAIDVVQNIDGEWVVQTVQRQAREAYPLIGIEGVELNQLTNIAAQVVKSITVSISGRETYDDEMHLFMKRISHETSEIHGYIVSNKGEKMSVRSDYRHYYVINEILEQTSKIMKEEYAEIQLHRDKNDHGKVYFQFVHADQD